MGKIIHNLAADAIDKRAEFITSASPSFGLLTLPGYNIRHHERSPWLTLHHFLVYGFGLLTGW